LRDDAPPPVEKFRTNSADGAASDFIPGCFEEDVVARYVQECLAHDSTSPNGVFRDFVSDAPQLVPARLTMPTMIIQGEHEASPERVRDMLDLFAELATNDKHYLVMPGGGHAILLEKPHLRWQEEVRSFLERGDD
jgi:pimeloyl-ACP methyl ester carboxylesterase